MSFKVGFFRDQQHGQLVPTGKPLANLVHNVLRIAVQDAIRQVHRGQRVNLQAWLPALMQAAAPMLAVFFREGERNRARAILQQIQTRKMNGVRRRKSLSGPWTLQRLLEEANRV